MKLMKRSGIYKAANVTFDPKALNAVSYNWWRFVGVVENLVVVSDYRYSVTTAKHQRKVRDIMQDLGIKADLVLTLPRGVRHDQTVAEMINEAETYLCDQYLEEQVKQQERNEKSKARRLKAKLETYLETDACFRDYQIKDASRFGKENIVAVHQLVERDSLENDVQNAIYNFQRDGFGQVIFYV